MSRLFIELYCDEDVSILLAQLLRARGFIVVTSQEVGRLGSTDVEQLAYAVGQRKTLLTHNRIDFEALNQEYFTSERRHFGIIIAVRRPVRELLRRLLLILDRITADEIENQVLYI
jgi:predicted nuclease of predicted toxin-antitoxin system